MRNTNFLKSGAVDAGNGFVKIALRQKTQILRSCILELPSYQDEPENLGTNSVYLEYGDRRIIVGDLALAMGGIPTYQVQKAQITELLLMAAIAPVQNSSLPVEIDNLRLCLPDKREKLNADILKALVGTRSYTRNGLPVTLIVNSITLIEEGAAAFKYAQSQSLFAYPDKLNAIADFGAGDTSLKLFSPSGEILRGAQIRLEGVFGLAKAIASYLLPKLQTSPDLILIMNGIASQNFKYGATDLTFKTEFDTCRKAWLESLKSKIKESWGQHFPQLGEILLVGGSAPLATPLSTNPRFKMVKAPQYANVIGMSLEA